MSRHRDGVNALLSRAGDVLRADAGGPIEDSRGPRKALSPGTDLRADDLTGADLSGCLFLTQSQVDSAGGDSATRLPSALSRPTHWSC